MVISPISYHVLVDEQDYSKIEHKKSMMGDHDNVVTHSLDK